jgi:thymidylate synthase (FAD)
LQGDEAMVSLVQPKVIKLAETQVDVEGVRQLMSEYGKPAENWFSEKENSWHSSAEKLIEIAGRACYRSFGIGLNPNISKIRSDSKEYFENVLKKGDGSILEHASVTFGLMWVSRVLTHQLVRHRAGTAFSQESLRYSRVSEIQIPTWDSWMPEELARKTTGEIMKALQGVEHHYKSIQALIPWDSMSFEKKKRATSAIRRILPQGLATVIIFTANHRTLRWLIEMRTDPGAELEIRKIFGQVAEICIRDYPLIYGDFRKLSQQDGILQYKPTIRSKV